MRSRHSNMPSFHLRSGRLLLSKEEGRRPQILIGVELCENFILKYAKVIASII